jgi:hypothetical protein
LTYKPTVLYKSNQNRIVKRTIQYTETDTRAILAEAKLLIIEFWDKAAEADCKPDNLTRHELLETWVYALSWAVSLWTHDRLGCNASSPQTTIPVYKVVLPCLIRRQQPVL